MKLQCGLPTFPDKYIRKQRGKKKKVITGLYWF